MTSDPELASALEDARRGIELAEKTTQGKWLVLDADRQLYHQNPPMPKDEGPTYSLLCWPGDSREEEDPDLVYFRGGESDQEFIAFAREALPRVAAHLLSQAAEVERLTKPTPMVLYCPACGLQHIDAPEPADHSNLASSGVSVCAWTNPPHRSHLCHDCGHVWRPSDRATTGVASIETAGKSDSPRAASLAERVRLLEGALRIARSYMTGPCGETETRHRAVIDAALEPKDGEADGR